MTPEPNGQPLPPSTPLQGIEARLGLYYRALCGRSCALVPYDDDRWSRQHPDTATTLRLPAAAPPPPAPLAPDAWYRVAVAHRAMHHERGTFGLLLDRDEPHFRRARPAVVPPTDGRSALEVFFLSFPRPALAVEVFTALEDLRVDLAAVRTLPGLAPAYGWAQQEALAARPAVAGMPARSAVGEALVRISLGEQHLVMPAEVHTPVRRLLALARVVALPGATVETVAEATLRAYAVLAALPNLGEPAGEAAVVPWPDPADPPPEAPSRASGTEPHLEGDEVFDLRFAPVRYRDVPGPRYLGHEASGMPLREAILRMTTQDVAPVGESERRSAAAQLAESGQVDVTEPSRPTAPPEPLPHDHGPDLDGHHHPGAPDVLRPSRPDEHVYPEWDSVAGRYLPDWCLVREIRAHPGRTDRSYRETLSRHRQLLPRLAAALERISPAGQRRLRRMPHGDDLDLDACIDAVVDLRRRVLPSEHVYTDVVPDRRDVVVAFAVDLSSSTAERLPPDPRRPGEVRRVLDVEREALALLMETLERVGDSYGVYGFSGTGRREVQVRTVKSVEERRTPTVLRRLDGLAPVHTTRMGPVIRHLTRTLVASPAPTKLLLVVSDGRPFDLDYGQQYGEEAVLDYAVQDTGRALAEARSRGVRPYLVTVDAAGADYLGQICRPHEYHVIADPRELPASLAQLYLSARRTVLDRRPPAGDGLRPAGPSAR